MSPESDPERPKIEVGLRRVPELDPRAPLPEGDPRLTAKIADEAKIRLLVLLRRDETSPAEARLGEDAAVEVLKKGEYMIRPGAGPKDMWGKLGREPWYNPYLLKLDHSRQERFFRDMIRRFDVFEAFVQIAAGDAHDVFVSQRKQVLLEDRRSVAKNKAAPPVVLVSEPAILPQLPTAKNQKCRCSDRLLCARHTWLVIS